MHRSNRQIVVVGAGMAGLSTAYHLLQAGFSHVTILEASHRVGGRIMSMRPREGEGVVEMGATCIHGASPDNPIYRLATDWDMADSLIPLNRISGQYYQENGEKIDEALVKQVWHHYLEMEKSMDQIYITRDKSQTCSNSTSMAQYAKQARPHILQHFPEGKVREMADKILNNMLNYCQFINGNDLDLLSADLCGQFKTVPGPEVIFRGKGYSGFVEELLKKIPEEALHLNTEVSMIQWRNDTVEVTSRNGEKYTADHVVLTCSLGHLKANYKQLFEPQLPQSKVGAIERTGYGRVAKLFLYYELPFWRDGTKPAWSSGSQLVTETSRWVKDLFTFDTCPTNPHVIGGPIGGSGAEILEQLSDEEISRTCTLLLRKFHNDPTIPEPTMVLRSLWNSDPLYRGAYSYRSVDSLENDITHLTSPLPDDHWPKLLFAGEATHPDFFSTVHGAFLSGVRESRRLEQLYQRCSAGTEQEMG